MNNLHKHYLKQIKQKLNASFVSWETNSSDGTLRLKIIVNKEVNYFKLTGGFETVTSETYQKLMIEYGL